MQLLKLYDIYQYVMSNINVPLAWDILKSVSESDSRKEPHSYEAGTQTIVWTTGGESLSEDRYEEKELSRRFTKFVIFLR